MALTSRIAKRKASRQHYYASQLYRNFTTLRFCTTDKRLSTLHCTLHVSILGYLGLSQCRLCGPTGTFAEISLLMALLKPSNQKLASDWWCLVSPSCTVVCTIGLVGLSKCYRTVSIPVHHWESHVSREWRLITHEPSVMAHQWWVTRESGAVTHKLWLWVWAYERLSVALHYCEAMTVLPPRAG